MMKRDNKTNNLETWLSVMLVMIVTAIIILGVCEILNIRNGYKVFYNSEEITLRDSDGRKEPLRMVQNRSGQMFIAVSDTGLFLDKRVSFDENRNIYFEDVEYTDFVNIKCKKTDGNWFLNDDLLNYDYTIFMNIATWCEDCDKVMSELSKYKEELEKENILLVGLIVDEVTDRNNKKIVRKINNKKDKYGLDIDFLIPSKEMKEQLQTNMDFIPNFKILDKRGNIVDKVSGENETINTVLTRVKEIKATDCGEC